MKNIKKEEGAITIITLVTILFIVSFLISSYIIVANKVRIQKEIVSEIGKIYEPKSTMEEIYNSYTKDIDLSEEIKVGDYVNYTPDSSSYTVVAGVMGTGSDNAQTFKTENLEWRILSIDKQIGEIELVSATATKTKLALGRADGYNHGVDILNDLCYTLYSGRMGGTARSINIEDINKKTNYHYQVYNQYGKSFLFKRDLPNTAWKYPRLYAKEYEYSGVPNSHWLRESQGVGDGKRDSNYNFSYTEVVSTYDSNITYDGNPNPYGGVNGWNTYYAYSPEKYIDTSLVPSDLLDVGNGYWVASRFKVNNPSLKVIQFGIRHITDGGTVSCMTLYQSDDKELGFTTAIRPVVRLNKYASKLTKDTTKSTKDKTYWNLGKY